MTAAATPSSRRSPTTGRISRRSCRWIPTACRRRPGSSVTSRSTTSGWRCSRPTRSAAGSVPAPPPARSATPCSSCSRAAPSRSASASNGSPTASRPSRTSSTARGPGSSARRSGSGRRSRRATPGTCPGCSATCSRPPRRRSPPAELARMRRAIATANTCLDDYGELAAGRPRPRDRRLAARPRAVRRARAPACLRRPRHRHDPADRRGAAGHQPRGASRRGPRDRPGRRRPHRHRPPQVGPPGDVRGGAGRLPGRDAPGPGPHHRARHRDDPARRARRGDRDAGVPAHGDAVRGLLRARPVRRRPGRPVHRHARRRRRPERDARALLGLDLEHEHPRGVSRPPPPARHGLAPPEPHPDAHRVRPSSSRAGACTASR